MDRSAKKSPKGINRLLSVFGLIEGDRVVNIITGIPYISFVVLLAFLHIANNHLAEGYVRKIAKTEKAVHDLRWQYMETTNNLMKVSRRSQVAQAVANQGLKELRQPPHLIAVKK